MRNPGLTIFTQAALNKTTGRQFDIKIDHNFTDRSHLSGRYSNLHSENNIPTIFGDGDFNDGFTSTTDVHNASLEHNFTITPNIVWTNRFALDRAVAPVNEDYPKLETVFDQPGDAPLAQANGLHRFPTIQTDGDAVSLYNQCCTDTGLRILSIPTVRRCHGREDGKSGNLAGSKDCFLTIFSNPETRRGSSTLRKA